MFLIFVGWTNVQGQNILNFNLKDNTQKGFNISNVSSLTFPSGYVQVNQTNGSKESLLTSNIRYFNFIDLPTGIEEQTNQSIASLQLFPNPLLNNMLTIRYHASQSSLTSLEIFDLKGMPIWQTENLSHAGTNEVYLKIDNWTPGMYVCRIASGNKIETKQLIINN